MAIPVVHDMVTTTTSSQAGVDMSHRQLLSAGDGQADSDITTDDDVLPKLTIPINGDPEGLLAFSIGPSQDLMKSPKTPATEKAQALEQSRDYFEADTILEDAMVEEPLEADDEFPRPLAKKTASSSSSRNQSPSPSAAANYQAHQERSSASRALLGARADGTRRRASSGPTVFGNFRRITPESPISPLSKPGISADPVPDSQNEQPQRQRLPRNISFGPDSETQKDARQPGSRQPSQRGHSYRQYGTGLDGSIGSTTRNQKPPPLRRMTSDGSLYLKRTVTGASDFDDTSAWGDVAEQVNSRFKALTDSLQDSSLKLPKLPNITFTPSRPSPERSNSEITRDNTQTNTGSSPRLNPTRILKHDHLADSTSPKESKHPLLKAALSMATGDLIIMGGYRGSILRDAAPPHRQLWVPVKVGLNLRKVDLEVGLTREDELKMEEKIFPSGTLSHVGPVDISRRLIKKCRKCANVKEEKLRVHDWGYDWRLSPDLISDQLIKFLESLKCNDPKVSPEKRGAWIIAHSLGGLISRHVINRRPDLIAGIVFAGVPQNCVNILGPLRNGDDVLFSSRVLTAQVNFTLRTSYALLPENGRCFLNKATGERYDIDFFDIKSWDEYRLTPCINAALPTAPKAPRKSIVGTISDSISSYTPSLPTKRISWFNGNDSTPSTGREDLKDRAEDAKNGLSNAANRAGSEDGTSQGLEPSMKPSHNKSSIATACTIPRDKAVEYLTRTLGEIKQFKAALNHLPSHQDGNRYPPHAILFGKGVPTVYGAKVASREAIKYADAFDELAFAAGDGVVLASAAQLPVGYRCVKNGRVESERGHVGILGDLEGVGQCLKAVIEARRKGVGMGNFQ